MTTADRTVAAAALTEALLPVVRAATRIALYVSCEDEPATRVLLHARADALLPVLRPDGDLDWAAGPDLAPGPYGLLQPTGPRLGVDAIRSCDLVLVPALSVAADGTRLGRGGGSYDRALQRAQGRSIALLFDGELVDSLPAEPHDRPVSAAATPRSGVVALAEPAAGQ